MLKNNKNMVQNNQSNVNIQNKELIDDLLKSRINNLKLSTIPENEVIYTHSRKDKDLKFPTLVIMKRTILNYIYI
jgi:hypothetical protein